MNILLIVFFCTYVKLNQRWVEISPFSTKLASKPGATPNREWYRISCHFRGRISAAVRHWLNRIMEIYHENNEQYCFMQITKLTFEFR